MCEARDSASTFTAGEAQTADETLSLPELDSLETERDMGGFKNCVDGLASIDTTRLSA